MYFRSSKFFQYCLPGLALYLGSVPVLHAESIEITADQWARPRSGDRLVASRSLSVVAQKFDENPQGMIVIKHAGGDEGLLWAEEMRGWFIALGIPGRSIQLRSGLQTRDRLVVKAE